MATQSPQTFIPISDPALQVFEPTVILPAAGYGTANITIVEIDQRTTSTYNVTNVTNRPGGNIDQVQFSNGSTFGGDSGLTYDPDTDSLTISGNVLAGVVLTDTLKYANGDPYIGIIGASGYSGISGTNGSQGTSGYSGITWINLVTTVELLPAAAGNTGYRASVTNADLIALGNFGNVAANGGAGANTVPVFSDGTNWIIG
jgi:hypothetical protein